MRLQYCLSFASAITVFSLSAQTNLGNQAVVTIIGNPVVENNFDNNSFNQTNEPPAQQQQLVQAETNYIEPTLENGFHVRFEMNSHPVERSTSSGYASAGGSSGSYGKAKKHGVTMTERSFNFKKKVKCWLPKRKKKYRPHLCGRF